MPTTVRIPLAVLTVQPDSANCFYVTKTGASIDMAHLQYVDSGTGISTWWGTIPHNLAATPAWSLDIYHHADSGSGGNVVLNVLARSSSNSQTIDIAPTLVSSAAVLATNTSNQWAYTAISGGNFDGVVAVSSNNYLQVEIQRFGGHASDTVSAPWNLSAVLMRIDVA